MYAYFIILCLLNQIEILSAVTDKLREKHNAHYYYGSTARLFCEYL